MSNFKEILLIFLLLLLSLFSFYSYKNVYSNNSLAEVITNTNITSNINPIITYTKKQLYELKLNNDNLELQQKINIFIDNVISDVKSYDNENTYKTASSTSFILKNINDITNANMMCNNIKLKLNEIFIDSIIKYDIYENKKYFQKQPYSLPLKLKILVPTLNPQQRNKIEYMCYILIIWK